VTATEPTGGGGRGADPGTGGASPAVPAAAAAAAPGAAPRRRRGLGLGTRIFLITSLLIALAVAAAVLFTTLISERIAHGAAADELSSSARLQDAFREQRYDQLQLTSYLFVADPYLAAYVAEASASADSASVLDLLAARRGDLGYDFAIVLQPDGSVLARTDRPAGVGEDLSGRPLVAAALTDFEAYGVWREAGGLFYAVAVPITRGAQLEGFLVTGFALSDATALEVKRMSGTEVVYLSRDAEAAGGWELVAGTLSRELEERMLASLAAAGGPLAALGTAAETPPEGEDGASADAAAGARPAAGRRLDLELAGERWSALVSPLRDAAGGAVGASVALTPLEAQLAPYRRINRALLVTGAVAVLAALGLTLAFARRTMAPVRELVAATAAARAGDYERAIPIRRDDELGQLAGAFNDLLSDLREKRDMEEYLAELSRSLPDPVPAVQVVPEGAQRSEVTLMLVEMRSHAGAGRGEPPKAALDRFSAELSRLARAVTTRRGKLLALAGHRVWVSFEGEGRAFRAFACGAELVRHFVTAGRVEAAPVVAISSGEAVTGAVSWGEERRLTVIGRPVQRLESLAREASPGDMALSPEAFEELRSTFEAAGYPLVEQRSVLSSGPLYVVDAATATAMIGDHSLPTLATGQMASADGGAELPTLSGIAPGSVVGHRFEILSVLGAGGMGVVYKARDRELDEVVAVKMLKAELAGDVASAGRLREELRLARRITHPNVLRTYDLGEVSGIPFISMEYVRGVTLSQLLEHTGRLAYSAGLSVAKQLCQGLAAAHAMGILHRDIKPANLILQPNGNAKLMDFGIARPIRRTAPGQTVEGWLMGTPKYLAPEQLRGEEPDARADIYAAGVLFYEMFTGASPYSGASYMELATKTLREEPPPPSEPWPDIPPALEAIILRCLAKDPAERYPSAEALLAELALLRA